MVDLSEVGKNIVLLRKEQGLTQEETAFRAGLSVSRLQYIEHGCRNTTVDTLIRQGETFGIDPRAFGIFSRPEKALLSQLRRSPRLPKRKGDLLQICDNIVLVRKREHLTQEQLACLSNTSLVRLRDIEHRCANVTVDKLSFIAEALGFSLLQLNICTMPEEELIHLVRQARRMAGLK